MENKKLQQFQQANLAAQKKFPLGYHHQQQFDDYSVAAAAASQYYGNPHTMAHYQQNNMSTNFAPMNILNSPYAEQSTPSSGGFATSSNTLSPMNSQDLRSYPIRSAASASNSYLQQQVNNSDQLYQTPREIRGYQLKGQYKNTSGTSPVTVFHEQYQQLQKAKMQAQIQTQNEAAAQQQRTFALRQALNPPVPVSHFHLQNQPNLSNSTSIVSNLQFQQQQHQSQQPITQAPQRNVPPSTLSLNNQFQPAISGPQTQQNYGQYSQNNTQLNKNHNYIQNESQNLNRTHTTKDPSPVYIQQNHPGHVVNQACQTQFTAHQQHQKTPPSTSEDSPSSSKSPQHSSSSERRKSSGNIQVIKSPISKRSTSAKVTLSGWLYKQGSEGLKVWRKRWFVLAEYCLFYYKGPEEEKLLGSITLPSYKVSACLPEDKIYRKYAFKCEHANMRTYWLAAENNEQMCQWIKALVAATMMQTNDFLLQTNLMNAQNKKINEQKNNVVSPNLLLTQASAKAANHSAMPFENSNGNIQPLYANAPPKPRRINEMGYSSPSPEISTDRSEQNANTYSSKSFNLPAPVHQQRNHHAIYDTRTGNVISSLKDPQYYENKKSTHDQMKEMNAKALQAMTLDDEIYEERNKNLDISYPNIDRRTPDAYGRSKNNTFFSSDYEDIYLLSLQAKQYKREQNDAGAYRRPMSPPIYGQHLQVSQKPNNNQSNLPYVRTKSQSINTGLGRPRSADFLEYEARGDSSHGIIPQPEKSRVPRPKSSLDINRSQDSYYYSEARYAEKMRQSALYLQKSPNTQKSTLNPSQPYPNHQGNNTIGYENPYERDMKRKELMSEIISQGSASMPRGYQNDINPSNITEQQNEAFLRSASARLPKKSGTDLNEDMTIDGERKREESMKRLLEWKQRMLQSPLTRKGIQQNGSQSYLKLGSGNSLNIPGRTIQRSRSQTNTKTGYNSCSSDDEGPIINHYYDENYKDLQQKYTAMNQMYKNFDLEQGMLGRNQSESRYGMSDSYPNQKAEIDLLERETSTQIKNLDVSAGDLLSRTHEELVLLLIQLRRQNSQTARSIEQCCTDIHKIQNRIRLVDGLTRAESIQRLDYLKQHLLDLERQYEKSKPLVNLVDNMVKLGSLYRNNENKKVQENQKIDSNLISRHEFNKKIEEDRIAKEEKTQWNRLSPNHLELQSKVDQLYELDQMLQEESGTLQNLQKDKEHLEKALSGIRTRLEGSDGPVLAVEAAKKQQQLLEKELARVHELLAQNSKKLEQTVAGNSRLEQELLMMRQKIQTNRVAQNTAQTNSGSGDSIQYASTTTTLLEAELKRVQKLVGDMQRQRKELSHTVRQLTENSNRLYRDINRDYSRITNSSYSKRKSSSSYWTETDLDSMKSVYHVVDYAEENLNLSVPLYVDTSSSNDYLPSQSEREYNFNQNNSDANIDENTSNDLFDTNPFGNLSNQEKQEIKTVRIVKRESERRHRDREKLVSSSVKQNLDQVLEESNKSNIENESIYSHNDESNRKYRHRKNTSNKNDTVTTQYSDYGRESLYPVSFSDKNSNITIQNDYSNEKIIRNGKYNRYLSGEISEQQNDNNYASLRSKTDSLQSLNKSITDLTPVFHSEAARQIINEMSAGSASEDNVPSDKNKSKLLQQKHRRSVPREKRRHNTAPNNINQMAIEQANADFNDMNKNSTNWRARDDLDMEVTLRPRINAPDVVRSALGQNEKISENTIDRLFGAPNKILIPERYIPEQEPELSPEEKKRRQEKVEAIKKMLAEAPLNGSDAPVQLSNNVIEEKKQREHLLQLNQILAQQVMQMSKIVAERAMAALPSEIAKLQLQMAEDNESSTSPIESLPIYQQRHIFYT